VKDDYQDFNRNDETSSVGLKAGYRFRRWLTLGAEYTYTHRDSNIPQFQYDKNLYFLTATASM
jgi:polysaccharide biosynthesis protein VpsM